MEWITILALIIGPVLAVWVGAALDDRKQKRQAKLWTFITVVGNRHMPLDSDVIKALNSIDVVFADSAKVRSRWAEYRDLTERDLSTEQNMRNLTDKYVELMHAMATVLGYGGKISQIEVSRPYIPQLIGNNMAQAQQLYDAVMSVLTGKSPIVVTPPGSPQVLEGEKKEGA